MLQYFERNLDLRALIWSFPVVFLVHDSEEVLTAERFWRETRDSLPIPSAIKNRIEITTPHMAAAVLCVFAVVLSASYVAAKPPIRSSWRVEFFNAAVAALFMNALQHTAQTLVIRKYTPGVVSALVVSLPYSAYVFHRFCKEGLIGRGDLRRSLKIGGASAIPMVLGAHVAGRVFARWFCR
jgi:hypothetical protein